MLVCDTGMHAPNSGDSSPLILSSAGMENQWTQWADSGVLETYPSVQRFCSPRIASTEFIWLSATIAVLLGDAILLHHFLVHVHAQARPVRNAKVAVFEAHWLFGQRSAQRSCGSVKFHQEGPPLECIQMQ